MRIMKSAVVLGLVTMAGVATVSAQTPGGRASFHIGGGLVLPTGDFGDFAKTGWQAMGGVDFGLSGIPFMLRVDALYGQNNGDEAVTGPDVKAKFFGGMAGGQFMIGSGPSPVKPYILAEVGVVNVKVTAPGGFSDSESKFAFAPGVGLQFGLGSMNAFVEAKYLSVQTSSSSTNMIPILVGLRFGGGM